MDIQNAPNDHLDPRLARLETTTVAGHEVPTAGTRMSRLLGLAWLDIDHAGTGLLIPGCRSVHTFGMRFDLDICFLDDAGRPLMLRRKVPSSRVLWCPRATSVLELVVVGGEVTAPPA